ncbi:MAG: HAMP domain-containing histidine kinase [Candidatus Eisenbacteria bacterium]|nr:HAMP domain-containing histidine kinase [Candidatus Eisenbacteria bacterium]
MVQPRRTGEPQRITSTVLRVYVFLGSGLLILAFFFYVQHLIGRLEEETRLLSRVFAQFCAGTILPATQDESISGVFSEVIEDIPFPVIVTDHRGVPWTWHGIPDEVNGISIRVDRVSYRDFIDADPSNPPPGPIAEVLALARKMDAAKEPIAFYDPRGGSLVGHVHYGDPAILRGLRVVPYVQIGLVAIFLILGYLGYRGIKEGEQRSIWIGMAKETAHQLGTPISSLLGWLTLLRERAASGGERGLERREVEEVAREMEEDVDRLNKIAYRFSNIGSAPSLKPQDLNAAIDEALRYLRKRFDRVGKDIAIETEFGELPPVAVNRELIQWVIENLFRNSIDALSEKPGTIRVETGYNRLGNGVKITFTDDGRGMTPSEQKKAFYPGYSTKRRGWGLGLPLSKRIVEEVHGGRITIVRSQRGKGTVIGITLPA